MIDIIDSRSGHCSHLFVTADVDLAASRALSWEPSATPSRCHMCGSIIDLTPSVARAIAKDQAETDLPPVVGWGTWRRDH